MSKTQHKEIKTHLNKIEVAPKKIILDFVSQWGQNDVVYCILAHQEEDNR